MKRIRCKFCGARPRIQFAVKYAGLTMCAECKIEYQAIFEGKLINGAIEKQPKNPLFEAFKRGWEQTEVDHKLNPLQIPGHIESFYHALWLQEQARWERMTEQELSADKERREAFYKRILTDQEHKNGISEDT